MIQDYFFLLELKKLLLLEYIMVSTHSLGNNFQYILPHLSSPSTGTEEQQGGIVSNIQAPLV